MEYGDIIDGRKYLSDIGFWPSPLRLNIDRWLQNFDEGIDRDIAIALVNSHVHINLEHTRQAIGSSIRALSSSALFPIASTRQDEWDTFISRVLISFPVGRDGDTTASGYAFATIAEELGFPERNIVGGDRLAERLRREPGSNVLFLDDLAATGTQFTRHWERNYPTTTGKISLARLRAEGGIGTAVFVPVVSTENARDNIEQRTGVHVAPAYLLGSEYEVLSDISRLMPPEFLPEMRSWLEKYSPRMVGADQDVAGYASSALALSFEKKAPNNTVPPLQWGSETNAWKPIVINEF